MKTRGIADWKTKECEPLSAPTTYTRVDEALEALEVELEGPGILVDGSSFEVLAAGAVVLDPALELIDSVGVEAGWNVGVASGAGGPWDVDEVSESEICSRCVRRTYW